MAAALQIWSATYSRTFDALSPHVQEEIHRKVDDMGARLVSFPHQRLQGRVEHKLRIDDHRVIYEFDASHGRIFLHYVGHRREIYKRS